jgi:uncharacterized protein YkwD
MPHRLRSRLLLAVLVLLAGCTGGGTMREVAVAPGGASEAPPAIPALVRLPLTAKTSCDIDDLREDILQRLNALRASGTQCGRRRMPPAAPVQWSDVLFSAAARHSLDMAAHGYFDHVDVRGWRPGQRIAAEGYRWSAIAENIAGGDGSVSSVMRGWHRSPDHCQAMLDPQFAEVGVACVERPGSKWGTYWTMELGRRQ